MKVLFINTVFEKGSTGRIVKELGEAVEENGGEYRVAYGRGFYDDEHCYRIGSDIDLYIHAFLSRLTDRAGFYSTEATKKLIRFIKEYNPDVIHLHNLHGYYINIGVLFNYLKTEFVGKVIWTLHDCWAFTGHCTYYSYFGCLKWMSECSSCRQKHEYPASYVLDNSQSNYKRKHSIFSGMGDRLSIVAVSEWLAEEVRKSFLKEYKVNTIYNGIDTDIFKNLRSDLKERLCIQDKYIFLCVSDGWDKRKGYEQVLELAECIDSDSVLIVIGLNQKQIKELPHGVIGLKRTWNQQELVKYYSIADVLFNPSKEETFGLVTVESMACGTPAVVYNTTACAEIVGDERYGRILAQDRQVRDCLEEIKLDKKRYFNTCQRRVREMFTIEKMQQEYIRLYQK